jgi:polysaccharide export outer membrane protein
MEIMKLLGRGIAGLGLILVCILLAGCHTSPKADNGGYGYDPLNNDPALAASNPNSGLPGSSPSSGAPATASAGLPASPSTGSVLSDLDGTTAVLAAGDAITVTFNDVTPVPTPIEDTIKEDGSITLYYSEKFQATGKTVRALQDEIHDRYVPKYYKYMTPSVKTAERFFSVGGEVKIPNRYVWTPGMTVLRAIDIAGGFTDFSRKGKVIITRFKTHRQEYEDCTKALKRPDLDLPIYPGDTVHVNKRIW